SPGKLAQRKGGTTRGSPLPSFRSRGANGRSRSENGRWSTLDFRHFFTPFVPTWARKSRRRETPPFRRPTHDGRPQSGTAACGDAFSRTARLARPLHVHHR